MFNLQRYSQGSLCLLFILMTPVESPPPQIQMKWFHLKCELVVLLGFGLLVSQNTQ